MSTELGDCAAAREAAGRETGCCNGCHDDSHDGYPDLFDYTLHGRRFVVCCTVGGDLEDEGGFLTPWHIVLGSADAVDK